MCCSKSNYVELITRTGCVLYRFRKVEKKKRKSELSIPFYNIFLLLLSLVFKMARKHRFALAFVLVFATVMGKFSTKNEGVSSTSEDYPFRNVSLPWEDRVNDLVNRLTLEEIQVQMSTGWSMNGISRLDIKPYQWDTECLRGDVDNNATSFPQSIGLAAAFSPDLIFRVAQTTGIEVRGRHNDFVKQNNYSSHTGASCFAPVINIMRDSRWGRNQETYGEDPYLSGVYAANFIQALQGNDTRYVRASGGCKHFDAHGGPENIPVSRGSFNAEVSEEDWRMTHLPAFRMCVQAGTYNLMCSYNRINGIPACANEKLLTEILRKEWGFKGYVISDAYAIENIITAHKYINNSVDTVAACVNAGCNLELSGRKTTPVFLSLVDAVNQKKLTEAKVREMVAPLFLTRMRLGEFDPPEMNPYSKLSSADVETPEHLALALESAMKSYVLLKNNGVLPLQKSGTIGVVGPMANDSNQLFGDYSAHPPQKYITSPLDGLSAMASKTQFASGCDDTVCEMYNSSDVLRAISGTEINFVVLGTGQNVEKEGRDRPDTELPGQQKTLLLDVINNTHNTPVVVLLFNANPVNISFAHDDSRVAAILECFYPAQAAGDAIRHVLLNDVKGAVPAGRLPYTWPLLASQLPPITNYSMQGRTYRYFEGEPLYPFGYGLSYTTFEYSYLIHLTSIDAGQTMTGSITVRNKGKLDADEVVQIYIRWKDASLPAPKLQLAWFDRVTVAAGQEIQLSFTIDAKVMALWINDGWYVKPGAMDIFGGGQQPFQKRKAPSNVVASSFTISGTKSLGKY
ncbi:uncharacterized protein [Littorina saxatilis]|uniref:uncharacterized protein isoform X2 n=1 Tax=Littorina saxatilis TaxID=31220 RepID=UPI0038B672D4